jgi:hypothetical protein
LLHIQHVRAVVEDGAYSGAKASLNLWAPNVEIPREFSLAQIWMGSKDKETIEVGWQAS